MRVIAGALRGRPLLAPAGMATRPTADRVRETLFSMLASRLGTFDELAVADLFAGSGALGIEALSRGAASCMFVDNDRAALTAIRANLDKLGLVDRSEVTGTSAARLAPGRAFDLVLADPPYAEGSGSAVVKAVSDAAALAPGGWLVVETARGEAVDPATYAVDTERDVGRARLTFLRRD